ncbi:hypothetical protein ACI8AF_21920 [Blastococcus sp. SYSU D00669]
MSKLTATGVLLLLAGIAAVVVPLFLLDRLDAGLLTGLIVGGVVAVTGGVMVLSWSLTRNVEVDPAAAPRGRGRTDWAGWSSFFDAFR